jgi:glucans biosynthesis protein
MPHVIEPMLNSRRCDARTRSGKACRAPAIVGKKRCRMHGGAKGSGAPLGNQNALKHGATTREELHKLRESNARYRDIKRTWRAMQRERLSGSRTAPNKCN